MTPQRPPKPRRKTTSYRPAQQQAKPARDRVDARREIHVLMLQRDYFSPYAFRR